MRGAQLAGMDLRGADLRGVDLRGAQLAGADLTGARLAGADLRSAHLDGAKLDGVIAEGARFDGAHLIGCSAVRADLHQACLEGADLTDADLHASDLRGASLREARMHHADCTHADLREASLSHATCQGARFDDADLRGATLSALVGYRKASWIEVDLRDTNFSGAYLVRRFIADQNYLHEFRRGGTGHELLYWLWWVTSDCGRSMLRWTFWVGVIAVLFAYGYTQVEVDYGPHQGPLSSLYFSFVTLTTLGYGDVLPASAGARVMAMCEVGLGYVMLGGLMSILANKMARRAD